MNKTQLSTTILILDNGWAPYPSQILLTSFRCQVNRVVAVRIPTEMGDFQPRMQHAIMDWIRQSMEPNPASPKSYLNMLSSIY